MSIFRVTFGFAGANTGWTETHSMSVTGTNVPASTVLATLVPVQQARAAMLGTPFVMNGTRISYYGEPGPPPTRGAARNVFLDKTIYSSVVPPAVGLPSEPSPVQLQAQGFASPTSAPTGYAGNENWTYLGAPFDVSVTNAGQVIPANGNLGNLFAPWAAAVKTANLGWLAVTKIGQQQPITGIAITEGAQLAIAITVTGAPGFVVGQIYNIRVAGVNKGRSPCNGQFVATYTAAGVFTTSEQVAFSLMQTGGYVQAYSRVLTHVPYGNLVLALQTIKHKRGKPFLSPPGRQRKRIRA